MTQTFTIDPTGTKLLLAYEIVGPAIKGDVDADGNPIDNWHGGLHWAVPVYARNKMKERVLICLSGVTDKGLKQSTELTDEHLKNKGCFIL
jgi:hypothetical protein